MSRQQSRAHVAIIGSGMAATAFALRLARAGIHVDMFEKGPEYPYPHTPLFRDRLERAWRNPAYEASSDLATITSSGDYNFSLDSERTVAVGGSGTHWAGISLRMQPSDFRTRTLYGYGRDWPVQYDQLEPYYGLAESMIGVAGTDDDNPFAPPRSTPYPLPPFGLGSTDQFLAARLAAAGIRIHTTPQARTRHAYDGRAACQNFGMCHVCPIGARYSPNHHLLPLVSAGRCTLHTETSVRRILTDPRGRATGLLVQHRDESVAREVPVRWVVLAGGAIESIRLLLLSQGAAWADGLGNQSGQLGSGFSLHHTWWNNLIIPEPIYGGRFGGYTGQSFQFLDPPSRGRHGALKVLFPSHPNVRGVQHWGDWSVTGPQLEKLTHYAPLLLTGESPADPRRRVTLSERTDRFGDPFAHVHYMLTDFDIETYGFARDVYGRFASALNADGETEFAGPERYSSGAHHMGGCSMSDDPEDGVVDSFGVVHGCENLYVAGSSIFVGSSGAVNPSLTLLALAIRSADQLVGSIQSATP